MEMTDQASAEVLCDVCHKEERKYKCPRCGASTCSLDCCRAHKQQAGCSGKRERIQFVGAGDFSDKTLREDFHFLEDVLKSRVGAKRNFLAITGSSSQAPKPVGPKAAPQAIHPQNLSAHSKAAKSLVKAAGQRGTKLLLQPVGMSKRKENTSAYNSEEDAILWRLAVVFILRPDFEMVRLLGLDVSHQDLEKIVTTDAPAICLHLHQCSELDTLSTVKSRVLSSIPSGTILKQVLKPLIANMRELQCFLRVLPSPADNPVFKFVSPSTSLRDSLAGMTVIEFPTIFVGSTASTSRLRQLVAEQPSSPQVIVLQEEHENEKAEDEEAEEAEEENEGDREKRAVAVASAAIGEWCSQARPDQHRESMETEEPPPPASTESNDEMEEGEDRGEDHPSRGPPSYGGMLIVDYSSSDSDSDSEEEGEERSDAAEGVPLAPGASNKYKEFMEKLAEMQRSMPPPSST